MHLTLRIWLSVNRMKQGHTVQLDEEEKAALRETLQFKAATQIAEELGGIVRKGACTIGITSLQYSQSQPSRHVSGKHLYDAVDLVIDNHAVKGDAVLTYPGVPVPFAPTSTVIGAVILNGIFAEAIVMMTDQGYEPPVFLSGNIDGADERNRQLIARYRDRISLLS